MFTGIIEEIGKIISIRKLGSGGIELEISANKIFDDLKIDDSVAINGVCQTVISIDNNNFSVQAVEETIKKTTLGLLRVGSRVNLERALTLQTRLGGHLVQGHVDCTGKIERINQLSASEQIFVSFDSSFSKYLVRTGSICLDGVSLTVASIETIGEFMLSVIPHTLQNTIIDSYSAGSIVNLEFDVIGKYLENLISPQKENSALRSPLSVFIDQPEL